MRRRPWQCARWNSYRGDLEVLRSTGIYTVPGTPLTVGKGIGGAIDLYWSPSCLASDVDYGVYEGTLGDFTSHVSRICATSGTTTATIVPGAGSMYYLVVPHNGSVGGSYGRDGASVERPPP